jgi:hypothetical protein
MLPEWSNTTARSMDGFIKQAEHSWNGVGVIAAGTDTNETANKSSTVTIAPVVGKRPGRVCGATKDTSIRGRILV